MCRSLSCIHNMSTIQIALFHIVYNWACIFHLSINTMTCIRHEKETEYQKVMSRGRMGWAGVGGQAAQARPHWKVANGCRGLIDCFASGWGACEAGWLWLGTWNEVNEVTTGVVATRQTWTDTPAAWQQSSDRLGQRRFRGLCSVTAYMRRFPEIISNWHCDCNFCLNVLYDKGNWSISIFKKRFPVSRLFSVERKEELFWLQC